MRMQLRWSVGLAAFACSGGASGVAAAQAPSSAPLARVGVPVAGTIGPTGQSLFEINRLVRTGDELLLSVRYDRVFCLLGPTDVAGFQAEEQAACAGPGLLQGGQGRVVVPYMRATGHPILRFFSRPGSRGSERFEFTVEQVIRRVVLSTAVGSVAARRVRFTLHAKHGDGASVSDGLDGNLTWRYAGTSSRKRKLATATTTNGTLRFEGRLPDAAQGRRVELQACLAPRAGSSPRCTTRTVRVRRHR